MINSSVSLLPFLQQAASGANLSAEQAHEAMSVLHEGNASDAAIAGFLVALRMQGDTASERPGFARAMREQAVFRDAGPAASAVVGQGWGGGDEGRNGRGGAWESGRGRTAFGAARNALQGAGIDYD